MTDNFWLWVFNPEFDNIGLLDSYISCSWGEQYQNRGAFTLVVPDSMNNIKLLQEEYYLHLPNKPTAMFIKHRRIDSKEKTISLYGYTTLEKIDQRGILGTRQFYNAEHDMKEVLAENIRGLPHITIAENKGFTERFRTQYSYTSFLDVFSEICAETELGIRLLFDHRNKQHIFDVYKGLDRTYGQHENPVAMFSDEWGTMANLSISDDKSLFKNVAYVAGMGKQEERIIHEVGTATGANRYELFVDARDLQQEEDQTLEEYLEILEARGIAKLNEHNRRINFRTEAADGDFGKKYNLGDLVTCKSQRYGVTINTRIMQYNQIIENNSSKVYLTLGEPEITAIGELKLWLR